MNGAAANAGRDPSCRPGGATDAGGGGQMASTSSLSTTASPTSDHGRSGGGGGGGGFWGILCPPTSLSNKHPLDVAANIWCDPPDNNKCQTIKKMSLPEREKIWADLSGNSVLSNYTPPSLLPEDEQQITTALHEMEQEVNNLLSLNTNLSASSPRISSRGGSSQKENKSAYELASEMNSQYVKRRKLWLMYLRTDQYNGKAAAKRMLKHYEWKLRLFGKDLLCKDITEKDLTQEEQTIVQNKSNGLYWLSSNIRDHAGRRILIHRMSLTKYDQPTVELRIMYVMFSKIALHDETFQKCGFVSIPYLMDNYPYSTSGGTTVVGSNSGNVGNGNNGGNGNGGGVVNYELIRQMIELSECSPIRFVAKYIICQQDPNLSTPWLNVVDLAANVVAPYLKVRTRLISGTFVAVACIKRRRKCVCVCVFRI